MAGAGWFSDGRIKGHQEGNARERHQVENVRKGIYRKMSGKGIKRKIVRE